MRSILCIVILCASSVFALGQSTEPGNDIPDTTKPGTGLKDTLTTLPTPIPISEDDADNSFNSWSTFASSADNPAPNNSFKDFGGKDFGGPATKASIPLSPKNLYVFHDMDWEEKAKCDGSPENNQASNICWKSSKWYVYQYTGKQFEVILPVGGSLPPIYGKTNVVLLSISRIRVVENSNTQAPIIQYSANPSQRTASNVTALETLINAVLGITPSVEKAYREEQPQYKYYYKVQAFVVSPKDLHAPFDVAFTATATPATKDGQAVVQGSHISQGDASSKGQNTQGNAPASTSVSTKVTDCSPLTNKGNCSFSRTFTVDSRQYWNVGVNIIVKGPRENKYALSSSNVVTQTHTIHAPLIAAFDLSPWAYWLPMDKYPYLQIGVPLSGSAFHMPYFGLAQPLPFTKKWLPISAYGGVVLMKQTFPKTISVGQTATTAAFNSDLETDWPIKAVYGIEVPVSSIIKKVKSSVGAGK